MALSWNEIKKRSIEFVKEFEGEEREHAEAKTFWDSFFNIFGITRRRIASFEEPVKQLDKEYGFIDLFWKSNLIVEHKSKGKSLDKAYSQALAYFNGLDEEELPKYVIVSDFSRFRLYDIEGDTFHEFTLNELPKNIHRFGFILGYQKKVYKDEDPVNIKAAEMMGKLHDALLNTGYTGHKLEVFLVRLLFCLFADDTGIFSKDHFNFYIEKKTNEDGSDVGMHIAMIFQVLNTEENLRLNNLDEDLAVFPYVNGKLFEEQFPVPAFDSEMRKLLLACAGFDWSKVSPAIFGSMFQSVMDKEKRRNLGAHYTSEKNILKVVRGLFLDELYKEFESCKNNLRKLETFHEKIAHLKFFDPACGCGNFLVITYREIRLLEIEVLKQILKLKKTQQLELNVELLSKIDVDCMYGIEYEEFPARIAEVALYLSDHLCNTKLSEEFGQYYRRLPLKKSPNIIHSNALRIDWAKLSSSGFDFILGNPPFVSKNNRTKEQNNDMDVVCSSIKNSGLLDYVCAWYVKASQYLNSRVEACLKFTKLAFVSTNSITQGEQVGVLWNYLLKQNIKINFAHRTFKWSNEARGQAAVYCVIVGFSNFDVSEKFIYDYETPKSEPHLIKARNINPYLVDFEDLVIESRQKPIFNIPLMYWGNKPVDGGNLILTNEEMLQLIKEEPHSKKYIKELISAKEFINGIKRWCIWLVDVDPKTIREMPLIHDRVKRVKEMREKSIDAGARELAKYPSMFRDKRNPKSYILIPSTTSENRHYIPYGFFGKQHIAHNSCHIIPEATEYHFGILTSGMHMSWVKYVCGRLEARYRYSKDLVYNNFPFPQNPTEKQIARVEKAVKEMLAVREKYFVKGSTLADLYDPVAMPKDLTNAHKEIDDAVDQCYRKEKFTTEFHRLEYLFELYKQYTAPLNFAEQKRRKVKNNS